MFVVVGCGCLPLLVVECTRMNRVFIGRASLDYCFFSSICMCRYNIIIFILYPYKRLFVFFSCFCVCLLCYLNITLAQW